MYQHLGSNGAAIGKQVASTAVSTAAKFGATSFATFVGAGSAAGPIGTIVAGLVSFLASLFGAKQKDPVFGVTVIFPETDGGILKVGRLLDLLEKKLFDASFGWGVKNKQQRQQVYTAAKAELNISPQGAVTITSGGLPTAHTSVNQMKWNSMLQFTNQLRQPFIDILGSITNQEVKNAILNTDTGFKPSKSYYFAIEKLKMSGPAGIDRPLGTGNKWSQAGISQQYDAVKISGGESLKNSMNKAWKTIPKVINEAFIANAGIDVMLGAVTDQAKADIAFKTVSTSAGNIAAGSAGSVTNIFPLLLLAGGIYLLTRR